jgi:predicted nucleotidyltransferase
VVAPASSVPRALLEAVVSYFHPRRVILFGSIARGDAGVGSDIDLVVELDDDIPQEMMSAHAIQAAREGYHDPVDIIPYRASVLASRARAIGSFAHIVLRDGVTVYERT